ncbi:hypothetical protein B0H10DRAFT_1785408 [Mycena sp. CBHHK59/15]|nr:hypothetical protein B0H10DRAFT_1785408 [Mycena sp. CBHHK59/15]
MPLERCKAPAPLSSLSEWSMRHICDVFEAPSDDLARRAIAATFSDKLVASLNSVPLTLDELCRLVISMRHSAPCGLKVDWKQASETPDDSTNQDGSLVGAYTIRGIRKPIPGSNRMCNFERRKKVSARIESQSPEPGVDTRMIVSLNLVASDVLVDPQALRQ